MILIKKKYGKKSFEKESSNLNKFKFNCDNFHDFYIKIDKISKLIRNY